MALALLLPLLAALPICENDRNAPSPHAIALHYNTLIISKMQDPCLVKLIEVVYSKNNLTKTVVLTTPMASVVPDIAITLLQPPFTLSVIYADGANNTATLTWTVTALPYTTHYLVTMIVTNGGTVVQINGPPNKPLMAQPYSDPGFQASVATLLAVAAFIVGLVRYLKG